MILDVNVLVAASRADHPHHRIAHDCLTSALTGTPPLRLLATVVASFLRLVTHPNVFTVPTPVPQAVAFIDSLLATPGISMLAAQNEWPRLRQLCLQHTLSGNALPDAWIAACVLQQQEVLATFDRDFVRLLPPDRLQLLLLP